MKCAYAHEGQILLHCAATSCPKDTSYCVSNTSFQRLAMQAWTCQKVRVSNRRGRRPRRPGGKLFRFLPASGEFVTVQNGPSRTPAPTKGSLTNQGGVTKCFATPPNPFNRPEGTPQLPHQRQFHTAAGCISYGVSHISHADRRQTVEKPLFRIRRSRGYLYIPAGTEKAHR